MKSWVIVIGLALVLALGACSATGAETAADSPTTLSDGDLSAASQLALGTLQLEDSEQTVDESQAATLLPLWQAYQSLRATQRPPSNWQRSSARSNGP